MTVSTSVGSVECVREISSRPVSIVFIELTLTGAAPEALAAARRRADRIVLLTRSAALYREAGVDMRLIDTVIETNVGSVPAGELASTCRAHGAVAVIALDDPCQQIAASVREILSLPGPTLRSIARCQDKRLTRHAIKGLGRDVVCCEVTSSTKTSPLGYPVVVKPSTGGASAGVFLCRDDESFRMAIAETGRVVDSQDDAVILVEQAVEGPEYSAEVVWEAPSQRWKVVGLTRTYISPPPHRRELGVVFPGFSANEVPADLEALICRWLDAVELRDGVAHLELRLTPDGPALIEINPRFAGGDIPRIVRHCVGTNVVAHYVELHVGAGSCVEVSPLRGAGSIWFISPSVTGSLSAVVPPDRPWPEDVEVFYRPAQEGRSVTPRTRLAYVVATASDPDEALRRAIAHAAAHRIEIEGPEG